MAKKGLAKKVEKLRNKYRLIIYNETNYAEVFSLRLSRLNVYAIVGLLILCCIAFGWVLTAYTQLKNFIPGYDQNIRKQLVENAILLDSLEIEMQRKDIFILTMQAALLGKPIDSLQPIVQESALTLASTDISFQKSKEDSLLREHVENDEKYNLTLTENTQKIQLTNLYLYPPTQGIITGKMEQSENHYGVDIVATKNAEVFAVLNGTIIFSEWTPDAGYVIYIQHDNNLTSVYKHNSELLKKIGDRVSAGEVITFVGNSGEMSSGPHLHFELWHKGIPLNPEDYIAF